MDNGGIVKETMGTIHRTIKRGVARLAPPAIVCAVAMLATARPAGAQGCILIRQNSPVFGAEDQIVFTPGEWVLSFNYRQSYANDHYNGTQYQPQRKALGNYVINTQQLYDLGLNYTVNKRLSFFGSLPVVNATWSIPEPASAPLGPRREQNASGIGDISALARVWLLDPARHTRGNVSAAIGFKAPTGEYAARDEYPDISGTN
jgi:hypothetical protein